MLDERQAGCYALSYEDDPSTHLAKLVVVALTGGLGHRLQISNRSRLA
jgi:hypothetical protein